MAKILSVENLSVVLDGETILNNLSFELEKGGNLAIVGPNGSGKTVLLKTLLGNLPYAGEIHWGKGIRLGYVPQKIEADRHLPLNLQNLLDAKCEILNLSGDTRETCIHEVGLTKEILGTPVGHLSGGEFQKALLAFALLGDPNVLILDEPTASIDTKSEREIYALIHRLQDERNLTVILVSHDLSVIYHYATKVLCLNKEALCFGTPTEALTPQNLEKLYGTPKKYFHHLHANELT